MCKSYQQTLARICNDSVAVISCLDHAQFLKSDKIFISVINESLYGIK